MYRFVFSWRWVRLHVLIWLVLIPAFIGLGMWQRGRYHERKAENAVIRTAMDAAPVPIEGSTRSGPRWSGPAAGSRSRWPASTIPDTSSWPATTRSTAIPGSGSSRR
ncbi:SURF1 family cytochrome oxidase biogenesis protein [Catenulispora yoronensis]